MKHTRDLVFPFNLISPTAVINVTLKHNQLPPTSTRLLLSQDSYWEQPLFEVIKTKEVHYYPKEQMKRSKGSLTQPLPLTNTHHLQRKIFPILYIRYCVRYIRMYYNIKLNADSKACKELTFIHPLSRSALWIWQDFCPLAFGCL